MLFDGIPLYLARNLRAVRAARSQGRKFRDARNLLQRELREELGIETAASCRSCCRHRLSAYAWGKELAAARHHKCAISWFLRASAACRFSVRARAADVRPRRLPHRRTNLRLLASRTSPPASCLCAPRGMKMLPQAGTAELACSDKSPGSRSNCRQVAASACASSAPAASTPSGSGQGFALAFGYAED
jgi:hypothetical protein